MAHATDFEPLCSDHGLVPSTLCAAAAENPSYAAPEDLSMLKLILGRTLISDQVVSSGCIRRPACEYSYEISF